MTKKISNILFYIFIFLLPWQTRLILTPEKTEFLSFSIYLSEIFLWLALAFWLTNADLKKIKIPPVFIFLYFYIFIAIFWSSDKVASFRLWLFIFDGIMVYLFLREHSEARRGAVKIFLFSIFIAALFGIWQFFNLGSPAFKWLGLATRGAWNLGDIVVATGSERWLRAYGPFPHPNIFGGYLAIGLIILLKEIKKITKVLRSYEFCYIYFSAAVLFFALFLTFSRSAWLAFALAVIYFVFEIYKKLHYTKWSAVADDFAKRGGRKILIFFIFLCFLAIALSIIFWPMLRTRATSAGRLEQKSNNERAASWKEGIAVWRENLFFGAGLGNYLIAAKSQIPNSKSQINSKFKIQNSKLEQPPHNIFILVLSQLGLAGFTIYLFLWRGFWKDHARFAESRRAACPFLILFLVVGMLDHYLWTLYPGQILFWLVFGIINTEGGNHWQSE